MLGHRSEHMHETGHRDTNAQLSKITTYLNIDAEKKRAKSGDEPEREEEIPI